MLSKSTIFGILVGIVTGGLILAAGLVFVRYYLFANDERDPRFQKRSCLVCGGLAVPTTAFGGARLYWTRPPALIPQPQMISRAGAIGDGERA